MKLFFVILHVFLVPGLTVKGGAAGMRSPVVMLFFYGVCLTLCVFDISESGGFNVGFDVASYGN